MRPPATLLCQRGGGSYPLPQLPKAETKLDQASHNQLKRLVTHSAYDHPLSYHLVTYLLNKILRRSEQAQLTAGSCTGTTTGGW
jgi:hypothetical protein